MKMYDIKSYDERGKQIEYAQFAWSGTATELEEVLYILYEIEPKGRYWKETLSNTECATFTYHGLYDMIVIVDHERQLIKVVDIQ